jgi:hypothetical protein
MKTLMTITKIALLALVAAALLQSTSCAWFQKNEPKLACAAEDTVADLPELVAIVTQCATIAASTANVVPCILAAAGSKWPEEVVACVASAEASKTPVAAPESGATRSPSRLREAVNAKWGKQLGAQ